MKHASTSLDDKFTRDEGRIFVSGPQALVRIAIEQVQRDRRAGLNTAGFVSGYRGSPLGNVDNAFWHAEKHLSEYNIKFVPGLNEEAAATACHGTQEVKLIAGSDYDGVFAMWYGKGPGVDRAGDALKHGNLYSTSSHGGVLVLAGDDHSAKSSSIAHQSEQALASFMIPVLYPASIQEYVDYGLLGIAMSRYSGLWVGFKCVNDTADATASIEVNPDRLKIKTPEDFAMPPGGLNVRHPYNRFDQERRVLRYGLAAAQAFVRANGIDRTIYDSPRRDLGIVTAGKAYFDVLQALRNIGIEGDRAAALGIRVYKLGMTWPVEPEGLRAFARGHREILVVEDKRPFIEPQVRDALYILEDNERPVVYGKFDDQNELLLQPEGELNPALIGQALAKRVSALGIADHALTSKMAAANAGGLTAPAKAATDIVRVPYYCSGCPHNTSTKVIDDGITLGGIGCHSLVTLMPDRPTHTFMQMGGEGMNWIGMSPFAKKKHVFQNLGDGTYFHSGLLAIRATVSAKANITYKILFNDAVALTGGQPLDGQLSLSQLTYQLWSEGVKRIVIVADDPDKYPSDMKTAPGVTIRPREDMELVQRELREIEGTTVVIYDQVCAAEKRRRRKRGTFSDPAKRVFINERVCEGCGDCGVASNCVSIQPKDTEFGRKRQIDQSSCNKDYSCVNGFCPSFVTVHGEDIVKSGGEKRRQFEIPALPEPAQLPLDGTYSILVTGIGGTGVVTVGAILGMAAHLEDKGCSILDMTGLSQKNGAVLSHIRIADRPDAIFAASIGREESDLVLACDLLVAGSQDAFASIRPNHTAAILNSDISAPAAFVRQPDLDLKSPLLLKRITDLGRDGAIHSVAATQLATAALGDSIATNLFMVGFASQKGLLPIAVESIEQAVRLNGVAVNMNLRAFQLGRWAAHDPAAVDAIILPPSEKKIERFAESLEEIMLNRAQVLTDYQNAAYAQRYRELVSFVADAERRTAKSDDLAKAVARYFFKLMAYKDEYEVARLYTDPAFGRDLQQQFKGKFKLQFHLAPPLLARRDPITGHLRKMTFGPWLRHGFRLLAAMKGLRGTHFDIFGRTAERKTERHLINVYEARMRELMQTLTPANHALFVQLASIPEQIRGYGHVKEAHLKRAIAAETEILAKLQVPAGDGASTRIAI